MSLIVDASVAVKWVAEEPGSAKARDLIGSGQRLLAPDLVLVEAGNALRKKLARGVIDRVQALSGVQTVERAFDELFPARPLVHAAIRLALDLRHPVYDCCLSRPCGAREPGGVHCGRAPVPRGTRRRVRGASSVSHPPLSLHELDPAVLRAALARAVIGERLCWTVAGARQAGAGDAAGGDRLEDRGGAVAGELLV